MIRQAFGADSHGKFLKHAEISLWLYAPGGLFVIACIRTIHLTFLNESFMNHLKKRYVAVLLIIGFLAEGGTFRAK
jgi:hypothetical protein